jgi:6-hydroxynicotinate 3-monooxygenase
MVAVRSEAWLGPEVNPHTVDGDTLVERFSNLDPKVLPILGQLENIIRWPLMVAYPNSPPWSDRAITLLGDAAHPMTPHLGQGGGMAVEDATILARCLADTKPGQYAAALRRYERTRYERLVRVQTASDNNEIEGNNDWLLGYNPLTSALSAN